MSSIIDILLEEVEGELDYEFSNYLEDYNISVMLEDGHANGQEDQKKKDEEQQKNNQSQNTEQQKNTSKNPTQQKGNSKVISSDYNQNNNDNNGNDNNGNDSRGMIKGITDKLSRLLKGTDGFIAKYLGKIEGGVKSVSDKVRNSETSKIADELSLDAIEFLNIPKQVCRAGSDLEYVLGNVDRWSGGLLGGLKKRGNELKNAAQQGLNGQTNPDKMKKSVSICDSIIQGINNAMSSVGTCFSNIWKCINSAFSGQSKQEHVFLTLEEEVDYLLEEDEKNVFITLEEEVDYLLS